MNILTGELVLLFYIVGLGSLLVMHTQAFAEAIVKTAIAIAPLASLYLARRLR